MGGKGREGVNKEKKEGNQREENQPCLGLNLFQLGRSAPLPLSHGF